MAQGKQTPRQKMINLMYLVFIAMMALNIDVEIIRSYYNSTVSLHNTRLQTEAKNKDIFEETLKAKAQAVPDTYQQPWAQYQVLRDKIDGLVQDIDKVKLNLEKESDFLLKDSDGNPVKLEDNYSALNSNEATISYFFQDGDETKPSKGAKQLMDKMDDIKNYINTTFGNMPSMKGLVSRADEALKTKYNRKKTVDENKSWLQEKFYNQPLIAAVSNLEIIQNDARNLQSDALALMLQEKVDASIKFTNYDAVVKAPTDIVQGTQAMAEVYLASYSNSNKIRINGVSRQDNGKGYLPLNTSSLGEKSFSGSIDVMMANGKTESIPYTHKYNVIAGPQEVAYETGAVLSADKMNVMYRGLDNPVSGNILGVDNSRLSLSAPGASVRSNGSGKWIVKPQSGNTINLTLSGSGPRGTTSQKFTYRIKNVPRPQGYIRNKEIASMPASSVSKQQVTAAIPDFDFPVTFTVTGFKVKMPGKASMYIQGSSLNGLGGRANDLRSGDNVLIFDIEVKAQGLGNQRIKTPGNANIIIL